MCIQIVCACQGGAGSPSLSDIWQLEISFANRPPTVRVCSGHLVKSGSLWGIQCSYTRHNHVCSVIEENLSRGLLNTLSLNVVLNIDYVMICLADRGHPFNSIYRGWRIEFVSSVPGIAFICQEVLDLNMAGTYMSAPARARTHDRRIRRPWL